MGPEAGCFAKVCGGLVFVEKPIDEGFRILHEGPVGAEEVGFFVLDGFDSVRAELIDFCTRDREEDGRVSGHEDLAGLTEGEIVEKFYGC